MIRCENRPERTGENERQFPVKNTYAEQISTITRETNYGTWRFQKGWKPMYIADAEGCWFIDGAGRRYLDFSAQLMCVNLGHKTRG